MTTINVTHSTELGHGTFKKAYTVIQVNYTNEYTFTTNKNPSDLVIVTSKIKLKRNKEVLLNEELTELIYELDYQNKLANYNTKLAPFIYKIKIFRKDLPNYSYNSILNNTNEIDINTFLTNYKQYFNSNSTIGKRPDNDDSTITIAVLEEKCGISIDKNSNIVIDNNFLTIVNDLVVTITNTTESFFKDFKFGNVCPIYDSNGNLINLLGIDFDPKFIESYSDITNKFKNNTNIDINPIYITNITQTIMYLQFYILILKYIRRLSEVEKVLIKNTLKLYIQNELNILIGIVSFILYLRPYTSQQIINNQTIKYEKLIEKNPFIYYILETRLYNTSDELTYNDYKELLKNLYIELVKDIYNSNEVNIDELKQNFKFMEPEDFNISIETNIKVENINEKLHDYLEYLPCSVAKMIHEQGDNIINNKFFASGIIHTSILKGIQSNNKSVLNQTNINKFINVVYTYIKDGLILYDESDRTCRYSLHPEMPNQELNILYYSINSLNIFTGGKKSKINKTRKNKK
jgi:hypothetical protein